MLCLLARLLHGDDMALKRTSSTIQIGFGLTESGANTFTQERVDLQLNPLDNEVFVVEAINLNPLAPDAIAATNTSVSCSITSTSVAAVQSLSNANCLADATLNIRAAGFADGGVAFSRLPLESPQGTGLENVGIISTNDFFIQIAGTNNGGAKAVTGRMYGYRAKADAATYAALVQSEVLSA